MDASCSAIRSNKNESTPTIINSPEPMLTLLPFNKMGIPHKMPKRIINIEKGMNIFN